MRLLFIRWASFMRWGIERAFVKLNINYEVFEYNFIDWESDDNFCEILHDRLRSSRYDMVFSVNFMPLASDVCQEAQVKYVSWIYDNPLHIRNLNPLLNSCNEVFFFDRCQAEQFAAAGVNAHHLTLASSPKVFDEAVEGIISKNVEQYKADISMVGQLYRTDFGAYSSVLEPYLKGYLEGIISAQSKVYGAYLIPELIGGDLLEAVNACYEKKINGFKMQFRELEYMLACEVTNRERQLVMALLAAYYDTVLYSGEDVEGIKGLRCGGYVDYLTQMPLVFSRSKINLNVSLKSIQSGIPLRVLDIMACGGMVLTNYQEEIAEYLYPGECCVIYESIEDMYEKAKFYLEHESDREKIAAAGRELIEQNFTFEDRIRTMFLSNT